MGLPGDSSEMTYEPKSEPFSATPSEGLVGTSRMRRCLLVAVALAITPFPEGAVAQSAFDSVTVDGRRCRLWAGPPGGSNPSDWGISKCAADSPAVLLPDNEMPPTPEITTYVASSMFIMVQPDGSPDPEFTRFYSKGAYVWGFDRPFYEALERLMVKWRFRPATKDGKPVRSGLRINLSTPAFEEAGSDTIPQRVEWTYESTSDIDSIHGVWVDMAEPDEIDARERPRILRAAIKRLTDMELLYGDNAYCPVFENESLTGFRHERLTTWDAECALKPGTLRLRISKVYPQYPGKAVMLFAGDIPPEAPFPEDDHRRLMRSWRVRCAVFQERNGRWEATCTDPRPRFRGPVVRRPIH